MAISVAVRKWGLEKKREKKYVMLGVGNEGYQKSSLLTPAQARKLADRLLKAAKATETANMIAGV